MDKNDVALDIFGKPYEELSDEEKKEVEEIINLRKTSKLKKEVWRAKVEKQNIRNCFRKRLWNMHRMWKKFSGFYIKRNKQKKVKRIG